jgi:hypothetical protein
MIIDMKSVGELITILGAVCTLLSVIATLIANARKAGRELKTVSLPLWPGVLRPFLIFFAAFAILLVPSGLFLEYVLRQAATYYWIAGNRNLNIDNDLAFIKFVAWQVLPVSIYSLLWGALIYPRFLRWFRRTKASAQQQQAKEDGLKNSLPSAGEPEEAPNRKLRRDRGRRREKDSAANKTGGG